MRRTYPNVRSYLQTLRPFVVTEALAEAQQHLVESVRDGTWWGVGISLAMYDSYNASWTPGSAGSAGTTEFVGLRVLNSAKELTPGALLVVQGIGADDQPYNYCTMGLVGE